LVTSGVANIATVIKKCTLHIKVTTPLEHNKFKCFELVKHICSILTRTFPAVQYTHGKHEHKLDILFTQDLTAIKIMIRRMMVETKPTMHTIFRFFFW